MNENIIDLNNKLKNKRPDEIVRWALNQYENPILTTNFRPCKCTILHLCSIMPEIKVVWCDSELQHQGYLYICGKDYKEI